MSEYAAKKKPKWKRSENANMSVFWLTGFLLKKKICKCEAVSLGAPVHLRNLFWIKSVNFDSIKNTIDETIWKNALDLTSINE